MADDKRRVTNSTEQECPSAKSTPIDANGGPRATKNLKRHSQLEEMKESTPRGDPNELNFDIESDPGKLHNFDEYSQAKMNETMLQEVNKTNDDDLRSYSEHDSASETL